MLLDKIEKFVEACQKIDSHIVGWQPENCLQARHCRSSCRRCLEACPNGALGREEGLSLTASRCTGCGACSTVCPAGALTAKLPSDAQLQARTAARIKETGQVIFACERYLKGHRALRAAALEVQCIARCHEGLLLRAVRQGATSVLLVAACEDCPQARARQVAAGAVAAVREVVPAATLSLVGTIDPSNALPAMGTSAAEGLSRRDFFAGLRKSGTNLVAGSLPPLLFPAGPAGEDRPPDRKFLPDKWKSMAADLRDLQCGTALADRSLPVWGNVRIMASCNGCEACADLCPTGALEARGEKKRQLLFTPARCTGCGLCLDACGCGCIELTGGASLAAVCQEKSYVLAEKEPEEIEQLLAPMEQRLAKLLGTQIKNG